MKHLKLYTAALAFTALAACNGNAEQKTEQKDSTLLSTDLVNNPRTAEGTTPKALSEMATMDFKDSLHDFGNIKEGEKVVYEFEFTNNGKSPLIIAGATGSCGCTVPTYTQDPIPPGKTDVIKVYFDSKGKSGHQEKAVTVKSNAVRGEQMLYIKAEVAEAKK
jgi:hypothetical protein